VRIPGGGHRLSGLHTTASVLPPPTTAASQPSLALNLGPHRRSRSGDGQTWQVTELILAFDIAAAAAGLAGLLVGVFVRVGGNKGNRAATKMAQGGAIFFEFSAMCCCQYRLISCPEIKTSYFGSLKRHQLR